MKAFISYSHADSPMLQLLHKHLAQLQRDGVIQAWTDQTILAGGQFEEQIVRALNNAELFLALLSPDYIASKYCYTKEFDWALSLQKAGKIIIVPIILEPCDWLNTPFSQFKALPTDGKAVSLWENRNTAFLDVIQNLRKLLQSSASEGTPVSPVNPAVASGLTRNYRVKKDFDSIEKMDFVEKSFHELTELMRRYMEEVVQMENIKVRTLRDAYPVLEALLVNRNKIATESSLKITAGKETNGFGGITTGDGQIQYTIKDGRGGRTFSLTFDDFHLYWKEGNFYSGGRNKELSVKEIADVIWTEWLESVGIL